MHSCQPRAARASFAPQSASLRGLKVNVNKKCFHRAIENGTRAPKKLPSRALFSSTRRQSDDATYVLQEECDDEVDDVEDARQDEDVLVFAPEVDNDDDDDDNIQ